MSQEGFKQRVERSSLGSRQVTAARVLASKRGAQKVLAQSESPNRNAKTGASKKTS